MLPLETLPAWAERGSEGVCSAGRGTVQRLVGKGHTRAERTAPSQLFSSLINKRSFLLGCQMCWACAPPHAFPLGMEVSVPRLSHNCPTLESYCLVSQAPG